MRREVATALAEADMAAPSAGQAVGVESAQPRASVAAVDEPAPASNEAVDGTADDIPGVPPLRLVQETVDVGGHDEEELAWHYVDPDNKQQGPCSLTNFRNWTTTMGKQPHMQAHYLSFLQVGVWKVGWDFRVPLEQLSIIQDAIQSPPTPPG